MGVRTGSHTVAAGTKKLVKHIVLVGGNHQLRYRQAHHAGDMARANIAKISGRNGKADLGRVGPSCRYRCKCSSALRGLKVARKIVHNLRHQSRPVD